ncbi:predicted protein [Chaetomium globosum CBS 148.51]|uniref:Uncharacterized protein n=1 Tax=Chaetomium globosum (strain ATCC 6205 / CBS 148.51 / DSM 1962 / NBRC 6347 / NRRL 1970) TaxID=306901 RepID=Q2HDW3_CHAGB|nr:uncharacterized protein CHGG_01591 [Chaetomium globosum CBS 148.51]EAQ93356.1 predicted protein [Chaetomium globosum CBS 148.51]
MPGEPFPSETPVPTPTPGGGPPPADGDNGGDGNGGGGGLSGGAFVGIAIGGAAVLILGAALVYLCGRRGGFDKAYRKSAPPASAAAVGGGGGAPGSPGMVEANYANAAGAGAGLGLAAAAAGHNPKSPGQGTISTYDGRNSVYAGPYPYPGTTPSPAPPGGGPAPAYGFAPAGQHGHHDGSPHSSPRADQYTPFLQPQAPAPVELSAGDAPPPTQSPPPGYQGR